MTVQCPAIDETSRVIYNSLRYDDSKHVVIFHLLEKDWNAIKDKSWLKIVSNSLDPIICSEPVFLGREGVVSSVVKVDPVEVFGLSFVQTFDVRPKKEDSSALEVIRFEENECSYKAELGIINPADNKSKMNVHFYPAESCPTEVNVKFGDKEGCTMYFSCSVNANSSKFQISRKQGKVWCQMPKREDGTVGESVIQNPATVPFHALERWDTGYQDTVATCGKMFRTKRDLQLKQDRKSGDAFYSLRESIAMVLQKHLKEPEVSTLHCVEDKPLIHEPYQTSGNIMEKKGFGIKVESIYRWNSLPVLKVIFYDCKRFGDIMKKNPNSSESKRMMQSFFQKARFSMAYRILADQKEIDLFRKMLYTNAARVPQEDVGDSVWKASFITLLFPREGDSGFFETGLKLFGDLFRGNPSASIEDAIRATLTSPTRKTEPAPACHFCHKTSVDLKKCMGCKKVSYCSKDCQRNDWKLNHKTVCRRN